MLVVFGPWDPTKVKDIEFKYIKHLDPNAPDWYGIRRPDFPDFYLEDERKFHKEKMSVKEMKKFSFTAWDDVPSDPDDEDDQFLHLKQKMKLKVKNQKQLQIKNLKRQKENRIL